MVMAAPHHSPLSRVPLFVFILLDPFDPSVCASKQLLLKRAFECALSALPCSTTIHTIHHLIATTDTMLVPIFLQRWILLNAVRVCTIVACALVIASTIRTLRLNFSRYPSTPASGYYLGTDIPTSFLGVFWSTLHHVCLCVVLGTVVLAELSLPVPALHRLFKNTLPFLGPNWGTAFLGVLMMLLSADLLSRPGQGNFAAASAWVLAALGLVNVATGCVWRAKAKLLRSPMAWKADVAERMDKLAEAKAKAEKVFDSLPVPVTAKEKVTKAAQGHAKGLLGMLGMRKESPQPVQEKTPARDAHFTPAATAAPTIFTPPLPSAVVMSRSAVPPAPSIFSPSPAPAPARALAVAPAPAATPAAAPALHIHTRSRSSSCLSSSTASTSSVYTLDLPQPPAPTLKTVRFDMLTPPSRTPPAEKTLCIDATPPSAGIECDRSPSVLASLQAAMLEAHAKASSIPPKKSLYLGSSQWRQEYARTESPSQPPHDDPDSTHRPYTFV